MHRSASMIAICSLVSCSALWAQTPQPPAEDSQSSGGRIAVKKIALPPLDPQALLDPGPLSSLVETFDATSFEIPEGATVEDLVRYLREADALSERLAADYRSVRSGLARAQSKAADGILDKSEQVADADFYVAARLALSQRISKLISDDPQEQRRTVQLIIRQLEIGAKQGLRIDEIRNALRAAAYLERFGDREVALEACSNFAQILRQSENSRFRDVLTQLDDVSLRLQLIGKPLTLKGKGIDGREIDLAEFRGKVVLVHFWSSDNPASLAEIPFLMRFYESNRHRGLEIVAVSLDRDRAALENTLAARQIPWPNLFDGSPNAPEQLASRLGVRTVPAFFLVDREGTLVTTAARSTDLLPLLEPLLPRIVPELPKDTEDADAKDSDAKDDETKRRDATVTAPTL
jgi:thiol-disulfide isomerase/thioredoxin